MGNFNPYDQENTNRQIIEALENIAKQLQQLNHEIRNINQSIRSK